MKRERNGNQTTNGLNKRNGETEKGRKILVCESPVPADVFVFLRSSVSLVKFLLDPPKTIVLAIFPLLAFASAPSRSQADQHLKGREYGFAAKFNGNGQPSLRFCLTRSEGMSPALAQTESLLAELVSEKDEQLVLLEQARK